MKRILCLLLLGILGAASTAHAQLANPYPNSSGTTVLNSLATVNSSGQAAPATTSNTTVPTSIVIGGAGTTGSTAQLAILGQAACTMDATNASAAGNYYVIASTTTAGDCHAQSAAPSAGVWVVGFLAASSTTSGSTALVNVNGGGFFYPSTSGGGSGAASTVIPVAKTANYTVQSTDFQAAATTSPECIQATISSTTTVTFTLPSSAPAQVSSQNPYVCITNAVTSAPYELQINTNSVTLDGTAFPVASTTVLGVDPGRTVYICSNGTAYLSCGGGFSIINIAVGVGGIWDNGNPLSSGVIWNTTTGALVVNTMYGVQVTISSPLAVGHSAYNVTTAGTGSVVMYNCVYNSAGTTLLWSGSKAVGTGSGGENSSGTQVILPPGTYLYTFGATGTTAPAVEAWQASAPTGNTLSQNGNHNFTAANGVSSGCPTSTSTLTAQAASTAAAVFTVEP